MRRSIRHSLVSWLCLVCFMLTSTVLTGQLVFCQHADGSVCLEIGPCGKASDGSCLTPCNVAVASADADQTSRCKDTPVKSDDHIAKVSQRTDHQPSVVPVLVLALTQWQPMPAPAVLRPSVRVHARPPDSVARLRTVVLLV